VVAFRRFDIPFDKYTMVRLAASVMRNSGLTRALTFLVVASGFSRRPNEPVAPLSVQLKTLNLPAGILSKAFTCDGRGVSPPLLEHLRERKASHSLSQTWTYSGLQIRSFADLQYSREHTRIACRPSCPKKRPTGPGQGLNEHDKLGYYPPMPPGNFSHRYDWPLSS
jgi:hypothetical protein